MLCHSVLELSKLILQSMLQRGHFGSRFDVQGVVCHQFFLQA